MTEKNDTQSDAQKLNPLITEVEIGIRHMRRVKIYPLSIHDQKKMTESITETLKFFFGEESKEVVLNDIAFIDFMVKLILENLIEFIRICTDYTKKRDAENLLAEMTNNQAVEIAQTIYSQNFETALKNVMSLLDKIKSAFLSRRPSQPSAPSTEDIDLTTLTDSLLETEDSPTGS